MITMELNEIRKIWDSQNNEPLYVINEQALGRLILSKKEQARHITNISELMWIIVNAGAGGIILGMSYLKENASIYMYALSLWMIGIGLYMLVSRIRRIKANQQFDRSMRGDLAQAISVATYQLRLSRLGLWNILPIGALVILGLLDGGKSLWWVLGLLVFLVLTSFGARWEHRIYKTRKHELELLQNKLEN
jgi:hypothetical protein